MRKQKGFTLIELLVVISIIGLLSTLAVVALNNARLKARDAKRVSDIKQIQTALELYYNDATVYPASLTPAGTIATGGVTYMTIVPFNPTPVNDGTCVAGSTYTYTAASANTSYTLSYCLGGATGGITAGLHTSYPGGIQ
jgi:prepilin-type N-terminal cleavage/methylation domain-containing protein